MAFEELKTRQRTMWGNGPYEPIVEITSELHASLIDALGPRPGERWLDVATGTGAVALRAARAGAHVTGIDLSPALVATARAKAARAGLEVAFDAGDAEALQVADGAFDVVCSAIGTQFAPDHRAVARELARVCRPAGRLGLACWTPDSVVAQMFAVMRPFLPPPPAGAGNTFDWGRTDHVESLLGADFELTTETRTVSQVWPTGEAVWETFVTAYGPTRTLAEALDDARRAELRRSWIELFERDRNGDAIRQSWRYLLIRGVRRHATPA